MLFAFLFFATLALFHFLALAFLVGPAPTLGFLAFAAFLFFATLALFHFLALALFVFLAAAARFFITDFAHGFLAGQTLRVDRALRRFLVEFLTFEFQYFRQIALRCREVGCFRFGLALALFAQLVCGGLFDLSLRLDLGHARTFVARLPCRLLLLQALIFLTLALGFLFRLVAVRGFALPPLALGVLVDTLPGSQRRGKVEIIHVATAGLPGTRLTGGSVAEFLDVAASGQIAQRLVHFSFVKL